MSVIMLARPLDLIRNRALRQTMRLSWLRRVFTERSLRNAITLLLCMIVNLFFMLYCPLWVLMLAPSILGIPHYIESISSFHSCASLSANPSIKKLVNQSLLITSCLFLLTRLFMQAGHHFGFKEPSLMIFQNLRLLDTTLVCGSFAWLAHLYRIKMARLVFGLLILAGLSYCLLAFGAIIWGIFVFSHNFMAFGYWYFYAPTKKERMHALFFLVVFALIHLATLSPWFDKFLLNELIDQRPTGAFGYSFYTIARELFPLNFDLEIARKAVILLCFGQGVHYILWIRVIPACRLKQKATIPFRRYVKNAIDDFGRPAAYCLLFSLVCFLLSGLFFPWNLINDLFFGLAFFHIYAEYLAWFLRKLSNQRP